MYNLEDDLYHGKDMFDIKLIDAPLDSDDILKL
jgi:hypothetical protein